MMDHTLFKIKRFIIKGKFRFTDKADAEVDASGITREDALESILNAHKIDKVMKSKSHGKTHKGEKVYVIRGLTYDNVLIYTKGTIKMTDGQELFYILISSKKEGIF